MKTKLKAADFEQLTYAAYEKEFKRLNKVVAKQANSPEKAINVFVKRKHQFACGIEKTFILACKMTPDWKKFTKKEVQTGTKVNLLLGQGYFEGPIDGATLNVFDAYKGTAQIGKIKMEAKGLLKKAKLEIAIVKKGVTQTTEETTSSTAPETTSTTETTTDNTTTKPKDPRKEAQKEKGRQAIQKMLSNLKIISEKLNKSAKS